MIPKILLFDTESSNLVGDYGRLLCITWQWLGEKTVHVTSVMDDKLMFKKDPTNDKIVAKKALELFKEAYAVISWYGKRHDVPLLNTRLTYYGLPKLPPVFHWDGWEVSRYNLKLRSNRLASASTFLGVSSKTAITPEAWVRAPGGHIPSIKYVIDHGKKDIVVLREVFERLRHFKSLHLNMVEGNDTKCPVCTGALKLTDVKVPKGKKLRRLYFCKNCGGWF